MFYREDILVRFEGDITIMDLGDGLAVVNAMADRWSVVAGWLMVDGTIVDFPLISLFCP